jgi:peptidoglycan hydrolase CwlO-like protein
MSETGWGIVFVLGLSLMLMVLVAIVLWQVFKTRQTSLTSQVTLAQDSAYRTLAEEATATQRRIADDLDALQAHVHELRERVTSMEAMMREVG